METGRGEMLMKKGQIQESHDGKTWTDIEAQAEANADQTNTKKDDVVEGEVEEKK